MENSSKLYRSFNEKVIGGVCGGLADYFNVDVVLIRVAFVLLLLFGGGGFLAYVILWIAIPSRPVDFIAADNTQTDGDPYEQGSQESVENKNKKNNTSLIAGIALISVGLIILLDKVMPIYSIADFWPLILILIGALMLKPEILRTIESTKANNNIIVTEVKEENKNPS